MKAILLVSHGSHTPKTREEIVVLANILRQHFPRQLLNLHSWILIHPTFRRHRYLRVPKCHPNRGRSKFFKRGQHVDEDIPAIVQTARQKYPQIKIAITKPSADTLKSPTFLSIWSMKPKKAAVIPAKATASGGPAKGGGGNHYKTFSQDLSNWYSKHKRDLPWRRTKDLTRSGIRNHAPANNGQYGHRLLWEMDQGFSDNPW